jgi:hypothetical protein
MSLIQSTRAPQWKKHPFGGRAPQFKNIYSILCVQTGSGAHPASCTMGTGGPFPGAKARPGRDADHSLPPSVEIKNK